MPKYRIVIEFETDRDIKSAHQMALLSAAEVQVEALSDGDYGSTYDVTNQTSTINPISSIPGYDAARDKLKDIVEEIAAATNKLKT